MSSSSRTSSSTVADARRSWRRAPAAAPVVADDAGADAEIAAYIAKAAGGDLGRVPALSAFQRRMEAYPQLSADAQSELVVRYQAGVAARARLDAGGRIGPRQREKLDAAVKDGERSMEYLVGSNFRLVLLICREKAEERFGRDRALDMMGDLVGEANVALTEAVRNYDAERCPVFSTYAARVVRDRVSMTLSKEGALRLAPSWSRLKRIAAVRIPQLAADLGRQPTEDEIKADLLERCMAWAADKLTDAQRNLPDDERREVMLAKLRKQGMLGAINSLSEVLTASQPVASLDAAVGEDGGATLGDLVVEPHGDRLLDAVEHDALRATIEEALGRLPDRERAIIEYRYGFHDGRIWTYNDIGQVFGVTAERIRQIERNVLGRLSSPTGVRDRIAAYLPSLEGRDLDAISPDPSVVR